MVSVKQIVVGGLGALGLAGIVGGAAGHWHFLRKVDTSDPAVVRASQLARGIDNLESRYSKVKLIESNSPGHRVLLYEGPLGYRTVLPKEFYEHFWKQIAELREEYDALTTSQPSIGDRARQNRDNGSAAGLVAVVGATGGIWLLYGAAAAALLMEEKKD